MVVSSKTPTITHARLLELYHYDPESGVFTSRKLGRAVGFINLPQGYIKICIIDPGKKHYLAHRLAWLYMTGEWPKADIDHRNLDKTDNRWANLRCATRTENFGNRAVRSDSMSGIKGITRSGNKWTARVACRGERTYLGTFETKDEAHEAYVNTAKSVFGEFAREN